MVQNQNQEPPDQPVYHRRRRIIRGTAIGAAALLGVCALGYGVRGCRGKKLGLEYMSGVYTVAEEPEIRPVCSPDGYTTGGMIYVVLEDAEKEQIGVPIKTSWHDTKDFGIRKGEMVYKDPKEKRGRDGWYHDPRMLQEIRKSRVEPYIHPPVLIKHPNR